MNIVDDSLCLLCGRHIPERKSTRICQVRVERKAYLQVSLNVAKEGNVADTSNNQQDERAGKDDKGEKRCNGQGRRRETVSGEVL